MASNSVVVSIGLIISVLTLSGCASLGNDAQESSNLVTAVAALSQAESNLYDQIIAVSAEREKLAFERAFVTKDQSAEQTVALYGRSPPVDYSRAKTIRLQLISQLSNYAQQVNAVSNAGETGWPASQATTTTNDTANLVTTLYGSSPPAEVKKATSVINLLAQDIVAAQAASDITRLATAAQPAIVVVQQIILDDNNLINVGIVQGLIPAETIDQGEIVRTLYNEAGSAQERLKLAQSLAGELPQITTLLNTQQAVSTAMTNIVGANQALATGKNQTAMELITQATAIAKAASTQSSSAKSN